MRAERQTDRQADHNTSHPYRKCEVINAWWAVVELSESFQRGLMARGARAYNRGLRQSLN